MDQRMQHVIPDESTTDHVLSPDCWCEPRCEAIEGGWRFTHSNTNAMTGNRLPPNE